MRRTEKAVGGSSHCSLKIIIFINIGSTASGGLWPSYGILLFIPVSRLSPQIPVLRSYLNNLRKQIEKTRKSLVLSVRDEDLFHITSKFGCTRININTVIPRLTEIIRSGITFVSRNVISRSFL